MTVEKLPEIKSRDEAEASMALLAAATIQRNLAVIEKNKILLQAADQQKKVDLQNSKIQAQEARLYEWAKQNRELMGEAKSLELRHGVLSFRTGNRRLIFLAGVTVEIVLNKLRALARRNALRYGVYIRITESLDASRILSDSRPEAGVLDEEQLNKWGLSVGKAEHFHATPKLDKLDQEAA